MLLTWIMVLVLVMLLTRSVLVISVGIRAPRDKYTQDPIFQPHKSKSNSLKDPAYVHIFKSRRLKAWLGSRWILEQLGCKCFDWHLIINHLAAGASGNWFRIKNQYYDHCMLNVLLVESMIWRDRNLKFGPQIVIWSRHWREFSISKNLVRISDENSRSITRNLFLILVPFSKFKIW